MTDVFNEKTHQALQRAYLWLDFDKDNKVR